MACGGKETTTPPLVADPSSLQVAKGLAISMPDWQANDSPAGVIKADAQLKQLSLSDAPQTSPADKQAVPFKNEAGFIVRALADFDGDGKADVLWQTSGGDTYITRMNGAVADSCAKMGTYSASVMGTGDFNGDGKADIVWRNMSTGAVSISLMTGATVSQWLSVGASPIALNVKLEGIGDFDGNGRADMLWRNQSTGRSVMSYHNADGSVASWPVVSNFINPASTAALKVGDINGDGKDDVVWRNMSTGNVVISLMDGNTPTWKGITASPIPLSVALEAIGNFNGGIERKAELLWRNTITGRSLMSIHNDLGEVIEWTVVSNYIDPVKTRVVGVGSVDGDVTTDILWQNSSTGDSVLSVMGNGVAYWQAISFSICPSTLGTWLPHTGISSQSCYLAGSSNLGYCNAAAIDLSGEGKQDGMLSHINAMSYSEIQKFGGGTYSRTECVRDKVTGLIWEGKEATGPRSASNTYTNYDDQQAWQRWDGRAWRYPTASEISAASNSAGYVNYVNGLALCGYTDWRLPTVDEMQGIVNHGSKVYGGLAITQSWFPNTQSKQYWTKTKDVTRSTHAWTVDFSTGTQDQKYRTAGYESPIRLVRGSRANVPAPSQSCPSWSTWSRFSISTQGNEVYDRHTGLTWARCSVGQTWTGYECLGPITFHTIEQAFQIAKDSGNWRLPNAKEFSSLSDRGCTQPAIDRWAFPGTSTNARYWTSTPYVNQLKLYGSSYDGGISYLHEPEELYAIRMVRSGP